MSLGRVPLAVLVFIPCSSFHMNECVQEEARVHAEGAAAARQELQEMQRQKDKVCEREGSRVGSEGKGEKKG